MLIDQHGSFLVLVNEPNCTDRILDVEAATDWDEQHLVSAMKPADWAIQGANVGGSALLSCPAD